MKILSAAQIYEADTFTIKKQQITSDSLMERAALGIFNWMHQRLQGNPVKIHLFCGIGNNGGDGLALARHLKEHDYDIAVYVVNYSEKRSPDFLINLDRLKDRKLWPEFLDEAHQEFRISQEDIVVDAIFGIGLNRSPEEWVGNIIQKINQTRAFVLSLDIPSGLFMEQVPEFRERVILANHVLSFQTPKLPFFLPQTAIYANQWEVLDIGLDPDFMTNVIPQFSFIGKYEVLPLYRSRLKFSHKGTYGHALLLGGSYGKIGAVNLALQGCFNVGVGLATAYVPKCGYIPLQTSIPEAMVISDKNETYISSIKMPFEPKAIGLGIGMGTHAETVTALHSFLETNTAQLVIDADGLNIFSEHPSLLKKLPKETILTPHLKELERLVGPWKDDFDKLEKGLQFSEEYQCILVIKGAHTMVLANGYGYINSTGNPGMATAGCGDALTGMITGFLAQDYGPLEATIFAVYLHGLAGDITVSQQGYEALTASKLISNIGTAFVDLFRQENQQQEVQE